MLKHLLFAVLLGIVVLLSYVAYHVGYFKSVNISLQTGRSFTLVGLAHLGPYHKIIDKIKLVESELNQMPMGCQYSFGLYLDDPRTTEQERLKSFGGCVVASDQDIDAILAVFNRKGIAAVESRTWNYTQAITAKFEGSPGIGPFKVYPAVDSFRQSKQLEPEQIGVLEVYEILADQKMVTDYYFPMKTQSP